MRSEHRAPLVASIVVVLACIGVMAHAVRTDALGGLVGPIHRALLAAPVLQPKPEPVEAPATAAKPVTDADRGREAREAGGAVTTPVDRPTAPSQQGRTAGSRHFDQEAARPAPSRPDSPAPVAAPAPVAPATPAAAPAPADPAPSVPTPEAPTAPVAPAVPDRGQGERPWVRDHSWGRGVLPGPGTSQNVRDVVKSVLGPGLSSLTRNPGRGLGPGAAAPTTPAVPTAPSSPAAPSPAPGTGDVGGLVEGLVSGLLGPRTATPTPEQGTPGGWGRGWGLR